jgi:hypothetical protein
MVFSRYIRTSSLIGNLEQAQTILAGFKSMGVDEIACLVDFGLSKEDVLNSLRLLATLIQR